MDNVPKGWFSTNSHCCGNCWSPAFSNGDTSYVMSDIIFKNKEDSDDFIQKELIPMSELIKNDLLDEG
jgi:hypothetical protein